MATKKRASLTATRKRAKAKPFKVEIVAGRSRMSPVERRAVDAFSDAVQQEYALLARKKLATVVLVDGVMVRGVPKKVNGRYIVSKS